MTPSPFFFLPEQGMTLRKIYLENQLRCCSSSCKKDLQREQLAQSVGEDEVMATELLVLQLPLQGGWDILQHFSIHDKSIF